MPTQKPPSDARAAQAPRSRSTAKAPVRPLRWLRSLFKRRLRLERRGLQVHVVLDPARDDAMSTMGESASSGQALRQAHLALRALLDRHPDARRTLRHLVYVEEMLARTGSRALKKVPAPVLRKAQAQIELLTSDMAHEDLATLHARIELALRGRANDPGAETRPQALQVMEASHSVFDEEERRWTDQMPLDPPVAGAPRTS